ncbi:hypothetical protein GCM10027580_23900 [Corynebacterium faecale]
MPNSQTETFGYRDNLRGLHRRDGSVRLCTVPPSRAKEIPEIHKQGVGEKYFPGQEQHTPTLGPSPLL